MIHSFLIGGSSSSSAATVFVDGFAAPRAAPHAHLLASRASRTTRQPRARRGSVSSSSSSSSGDRGATRSPQTETRIQQPSENRADKDVIIDAQIRAERLAVRLKLQSVGPNKAQTAQKSNKMGNAATRVGSSSALAATSSTESPSSASPSASFDSLDAAIRAEEAGNNGGGAKASARIEEERAAVRARFQKFSINRYAFVNNGANAGRVIDRVTGEAAPAVDDYTSSIEERVDLAQERVKQALQEVQNVETLMELKKKDLRARQEKLQKLGEDLAEARKVASEAESIKAEEKRLIRAQFTALERGVPQPGALKPGYGAKKSATLSASTSNSIAGGVSGGAGVQAGAGVGVAGGGGNDARGSGDVGSSASSGSSDKAGGDAALTRAEDAIRARASSSLSRLRRQRNISRKGRASRSISESSLNQTPAESTALQYDPLRDGAAGAGAGDDTAGAGSSEPDGSATGSTESGAGNSVLPKPIFVLSDCTGESAANTCRAALGQFEDMMNQNMPTNLYIFRFLSEGSDAYKIVQQAAEDDALVVYTLSDPSMATAVKTACKLYSVKSVNLWGPLLESMEEHLAMNRTGVPMSAVSRQHGSSENLSNDYFRMIEAVEFTRQMDDGARPNMWKDADILILGVSRTGKTPLSIYLGQRGYKVANLPLVPRDGQLMVPKYIDDVDPKRVFGLLINGEILHSIRTNRLSSIGVKGADKSAMEYSTMRQVTQELSLAKALYAKHSDWTVLDVTHKGVEETAARIMKIIYEDENANNYLVMKAT